MRRKATTRTHLARHSREKVKLLSKYVTAFLNVLEFAKGTDEVHILDLMCGEGKYEDGAEGSPISISQTVKNHHFNRLPKNRVELWLNDNGESEIEPGRSKIDRVQAECDPILKHLPSGQYTVRYSSRDAVEVGFEAAKRIGSRRMSKGLFFLDPHGYKRVKPAHIRLPDYGAAAFPTVWWSASDVGWVVGHSYIVYAPLLHGCTTILYEGKPVGTPDAGAYWRVIQDHRVKSFFVAPTAFRAIRSNQPPNAMWSARRGRPRQAARNASWQVSATRSIPRG